mmetsp:Transcript_6738/g.27607  ORF Transcript_6738/g.27607 Transcript_6738/m.27607 type:complete len:414 (-) Transcript_6738:82-1323(-)
MTSWNALTPLEAPPSPLLLAGPALAPPMGGADPIEEWPVCPGRDAISLRRPPARAGDWGGRLEGEAGPEGGDESAALWWARSRAELVVMIACRAPGCPACGVALPLAGAKRESRERGGAAPAPPTPRNGAAEGRRRRLLGAEGKEDGAKPTPAPRAREAGWEGAAPPPPPGRIAGDRWCGWRAGGGRGESPSRGASPPTVRADPSARPSDRAGEAGCSRMTAHGCQRTTACSTATSAVPKRPSSDMACRRGEEGNVPASGPPAAAVSQAVPGSSACASAPPVATPTTRTRISCTCRLTGKKATEATLRLTDGLNVRPSGPTPPPAPASSAASMASTASETCAMCFSSHVCRSRRSVLARMRRWRMEKEADHLLAAPSVDSPPPQLSASRSVCEKGRRAKSDPALLRELARSRP